MDKENPTSETVFPVPEEWKSRAYITADKYEKYYAESVKDPDGFWAHEAKQIQWLKPFTKVKNTSFGPGKVFIKWFEDGTLNVSANCTDRHLEKRAKQTAIIWEGDDPTQ